MMRARTLLPAIFLITSSCVSSTSVEIYCPQFPAMSEEERQDMLARVEQGSPAYRWFERLYVLKAELDACREINTD